MALIKLGSLVTRISGKVGGQSFGTGPAGSYIKNTGTPRKSITLSQHDKMSRMATTSQSWRELTQTQRDTFNAASPEYTYLNRVGETKNYSGYAIYTQLLNNLKDNQTTDPPITVPVPLPRTTFVQPSSVSINLSPTQYRVGVNDAQPLMEYRLFISQTMSKGISQGYKNKFLIQTLSTAIPEDVSGEFTAEYIAKWGNIPSSGKMFWRLDVVDGYTGQSLKGIASGTASY